MIALMFILFTVYTAVEVSTHLDPQVTWFTYYVGCVLGLLAGGMGLELWDKWKNRERNSAERNKKREFAVCTIND